MPLRRPASAALLLATTACMTCLACTACSSGAGPGASTGSGEAVSTAGAEGAAPEPHGYVDGATEIPEPSASLVTLGSSGSVTLTGLAGLEATDLGSVPGAKDLASDSRLVAARAQDGSVHLLDSGVWTVDHGDHQHYYQAQPRDLGQVATDEPLAVAEGGTVSLGSSESLTAVRAGTTAVLLDRADLTRGTMTVLGTAQADEGSWASPLGPGWVVVSGSQVRILDATGQPVPGAPGAQCREPRGGATTRAGVVIGCQDGAVVVTAREAAGQSGSAGATTAPSAEPPAASPAAPSGSSAEASPPSTAPTGDEEASAGGWHLERVVLPEGTSADARPTTFSGRPGRPVLAAPDPTGGVWLLDVREPSWTHLDPGSSPAGPAEGPENDAENESAAGPAEGPTSPETTMVAASALDDSDSRVVAVDAQGRLHVWADPQGSGHAEETVSEPVASPGLAAAGVPVTRNRAYVPGADGASVLEVDAADGARVARTIEAPGLLAVQEVGL